MAEFSRAKPADRKGQADPLDRRRLFYPHGSRLLVRTRGCAGESAGALETVPITWSVIYPLVLGIPLLVTPVLRATGVRSTLFIDVLASTGIIVALMIYVVMPHYTSLVHRWLFR